MRSTPDIFKFAVIDWMNWKMGFPQKPKTVVGVVGGTDAEQMFLIYLFRWKPLKTAGFLNYRTDGTDVIFLKYKI